jgi:hypothetical protein
LNSEAIVCVSCARRWPAGHDPDRWVRSSDCSACDCEFVALAMRLETRLVTLDKKILRAFPGRAVALSTG